MWRFIRPDSITAWKNLETLRRLTRYRAIIDQERFAKYLLAKHQVFDGDLAQDTIGLWKEHTQASEQFREYVRTVDNGETTPTSLPEQTTFLDLKVELAHRILQITYILHFMVSEPQL